MSEEEIKKITYEYGKSVTDNICYDAYTDPDKKREIATKSAAYQAKKVLEWLTKDYCIVPKDNARELCQLTFENGGSDDFGLIDGLTDWVCFNFDEEYHEVLEKGEKQ